MIELLSIVCLIMIIMPCNHVEADDHDEAAGDYHYDYKRRFFQHFPTICEITTCVRESESEVRMMSSTTWITPLVAT